MIRPVRPPALLRRIYPRLTWRMPATDRSLYLTFDDGPTPGVTETVLDLLAAHDARATFFCIGRNVDNHPALFGRIRAAGHSTGNHTYHHLNGWKSADTLYFDSVERTRALVHSPLFRPPYGRIRFSQLRLLAPRYRIVMWSVLSYDYDNRVTRERCLQNVVRHAGPGSIVVFHDSVKAADTLEWVLPRVLQHFSEKGFRFSAIPVAEEPDGDGD